ncbi:MAG: HEAT repeat domain-containing protein [Candidatus Riflebacteria bacterium]|nr:HEAT repeat domain-containing protein [Candidatus Riflebacteria bacterium]
MDYKQIAFDLKTGNAESIAKLLKTLFESDEISTNKELFEVLYDLKFHTDFGVKFWAKKVLNKLEVQYPKRKQEFDGPPPPEELIEGPQTSEESQIPSPEPTLSSEQTVLPEEMPLSEQAHLPDLTVPPERDTSPEQAPSSEQPLPSEQTLPPEETALSEQTVSCENLAPSESLVDELIKKLSENPDDVLLEDLKIILERPHDQAKEPLFTFFKNCTDSNLLSFLAKNLGKTYPSEESLLLLAPFLRHEDSRVVANTIEGIEGIIDTRTFVLLSQLFDHPDNRVRSNVAVAIARFNSDDAMAIIERMLQLHGKTHMQFSACYAIRELKEKRLFPKLVDLFSDPQLFREALKVFLAVPCNEGVEVLQDALQELTDEQQKFSILASIDQILKFIEEADVSNS